MNPLVQNFLQGVLKSMSEIDNTSVNEIKQRSKQHGYKVFFFSTVAGVEVSGSLFPASAILTNGFWLCGVHYLSGKSLNWIICSIQC